MKILIIAGIGVLILGLGAASFYFYSQANTLNYQLDKTKSLNKKIQEDLARLNEEKNNLSQDSEKLASDTVTYLTTNTKLAADKEKFRILLQEAQKAIGKKQVQLEGVKDKLDRLQNQAAKENDAAISKLRKEKEGLEKSLKDLKDSSLKEKARFQYNLGVAYTNAKMYEDAIQAYDQAVKLDPANAEAFYNLGVLYDSLDIDTQKAKDCFRKYLELDPNSQDRAEVQSWIERLSA